MERTQASDFSRGWRFVQRAQARLDDGEVNDVNIPRAQGRAPAPGLRQLKAQYKDQKKAMAAAYEKAMAAAYETGEYSYQQIGNHFGLHFTTVGRIVRGTSKDQ
jgi:putative transposase